MILLILYVINVLYDGLAKLNKNKNDLNILEDAKYITELGKINNTNNISDIHQKLLGIVDIFNKYYISYNEKINVLKNLLLNIHNQWIIDKYYETFYKYRVKDRMEIISLIIGNLLLTDELAISG